MANERLSELNLTDEELFALAAGNARVAQAITERDPRVQLHERLYRADKKLTVDGRELPYRQVIEEMGVTIAPDSIIARAREHAREAINDDVLAVKRLRKELEDEKANALRAEFRSGLRSQAEALGFAADDKELDAITEFMRDHQFGPKAAGQAVAAYYEAKAPAEPNFESEHTFDFASAADPEDAKYLESLMKAPFGADTSQLTMAHAERTWHKMFGKKRPA